MSSRSDDTRIAEMDVIPVNMYYTHRERSAIVSRPGITETLVKVTLENGMVGWGESTRCADARGIGTALEAMRPVVVGRDVFADEALHRDLWGSHGWHLQP
ncbi:MAG: hypothetical protein GY788_24155, partial [bacterium]|nr:hypothetical protein [bacterium]